MLEEYAAFEKEDRGHGKGATEKCGSTQLQVEDELQEALGQNLTLELDNLSPCHSRYRFVSTGSSSHQGVIGMKGHHFATTHHLGSISYKKEKGLCSKRIATKIQEALGQAGMQYSDPFRSFRGLYWYPPFGFTEWHTDGNHVSGWRIYLADIDVENTSFFVHRSGDSSLAVPDRFGQANMFRVVPSQPLWHAVASVHAQRVSVGVAVSEAFAKRVISRLNHPDLLDRVGVKPWPELTEEVERHRLRMQAQGR
mmetsp:Transcript_26462/g.53073  ORF Transcript_26462/g.53073 Transcript_26462/m.53073 type:complete len:253 (+) Transcript_26462:594-1352(+)